MHQKATLYDDNFKFQTLDVNPSEQEMRKVNHSMVLPINELLKAASN